MNENKQLDISQFVLLLDQMIKEENEALNKFGCFNLHLREECANNKYCLAIVKLLIETKLSNKEDGF